MNKFLPTGTEFFTIVVSIFATAAAITATFAATIVILEVIARLGVQF